jgi:sugar phosphate isomerase/epimerase
MIIMADDQKPQFKVGVSSGIYGVAHSAELSSIVRKLGYALTRGADTIEIAGDVPHEINYTEGRELRYIAEKQGLTLLFHGSLTVDMSMPERGEWRDAHDHIQKSIKSAVMGGCKYVNFHACVNFWLEMMTYGGRKLTLAFCDHEGRFISGILKENEKLCRWFVKRRWREFVSDILRRDEIVKIQAQAEIEARTAVQGGTSESMAKKEAELSETMFAKRILDKLGSDNENERRWDSEELRTAMGMIDGYHIMAHHMYYNADPIWKEMAKMYPAVINKYRTVGFDGKDYVYAEGGSEDAADPEHIDFWLDGAWRKAEQENDREFKEFFYAVCGAKYIEGHIKRALEWMKEGTKGGMLEGIAAEVKDDQELEKLKGFAKDLAITIEIPDARSPEYAGLYNICRIKQIHAAVKTIRDTLDTKKLYVLVDAEHIATQGFDPINEIREFVKLVPDAGKYILSVHVTKPSPLHHHMQVDLGDIDVYKILWELRTAGLGKDHMVYLIFERGGDQDPFKQSVTAIRLMVDQLVKDTKPDELLTKPEFFGVAGPSMASEERQRAVIQQHARDPIEGLLAIPEESYTLLGKAAMEKPGGSEKWKKEELT